MSEDDESELRSATSGESSSDAASQPRGKRTRAQTYSFKALPAPMFWQAAVVASSTPYTTHRAMRSRNATFTARPLGDDAPSCDVCAQAPSICKVTAVVKSADGDANSNNDENNTDDVKVTKRLCRRCALQQQEFAAKLKIRSDDDNRLAFLTSARAWSDLARKSKQSQ